MAKQAKPTLTPTQRDQLAKAGLDPDRWLKESGPDPSLTPNMSQGSIDKQVASAVDKALKAHDDRTISQLPAATPDKGEAWVKADGSIDVGAPGKNGVYVFKSMEPNADGTVALQPMARGKVAKDSKTGAAVPQFTEMSRDNGAHFFKVAQDPTTGQYGPVDQQAADVASGTTGTSNATVAKSFTPVGLAPDAASGQMTPEEEQNFASQGFSPDEIAQMKTARAGATGYTSPFIGKQAQSPGNMTIYKRAANFANGDVFPSAGDSKSGLDYTTVDDALKSMYQLPADELKDLQTKLFKGGYYSNATKITDIPLGSPDQSTLEAYYGLLADVGHRNAAGQPVTWEDVLDSQSSADVGEKNKAKYQAIDPRDAAAVADQVAQQVFGRKATVDDQRYALSILNAAGQQAFTSQQNMTAGTQAPDPQAALTDAFQQRNPQEAFGYSLTNAMDVLTKMVNPAVQIGG